VDYKRDFQRKCWVDKTFTRLNNGGGQSNQNEKPRYVPKFSITSITSFFPEVRGWMQSDRSVCLLSGAANKMSP